MSRTLFSYFIYISSSVEREYAFLLYYLETTGAHTAAAELLSFSKVSFPKEVDYGCD